MFPPRPSTQGIHGVNYTSFPQQKLRNVGQELESCYKETVIDLP